MSTKQTEASSKLFKQKKDAADKADDQIAKDRRERLQAEATKTARLRDQRLAKEAADNAAKAIAKTKPKS